MLKRTRTKMGKKIDEITIGERIHLIETIEDKDLLLYLGLTNDNNPLYIQHDYAQSTPFKKPIVPAILLNGIVTSAISKHLPGPGSHIREQNIIYLEPVYHYETIEVLLEVQHVDLNQNLVDIQVQAINKQHRQVMEGMLKVLPPV
ncbi:MAG: enoyl-CoA hydratase [Lysinibacillus sp.]|nr:enoyl-CoA hydratase [Lysinibacillus sp.]